METHRLLRLPNWCGREGVFGVLVVDAGEGAYWRGCCCGVCVGEGEGAGLADEELCPSEYKLDVDW